MNISTIGLDLAKDVFHVHGVDSAGQVVVTKKLRRANVLAFLASADSAALSHCISICRSTPAICSARRGLLATAARHAAR